MDIVLIHLGDNVPEYFMECVKQIRRVTDDRIVTVFTKPPMFHFGKEDNVMMFSMDSFEDSENLRRFKEIGHFDSFGPNLLWRYSCERFYALEMAMEVLGIDECLHIENDNMLYHHDPDHLRDLCGDRIGITTITEVFYGAGIMYVGNKGAIGTLCTKLNDLMALGGGELGNRYGQEMMNEMRMLSILACEDDSLITLLPVLPQNSPYVFDCASWGQWIGGTHQDPEIQYVTDAHIVGRELINDRYEVNWKNGKPFVTDKKKEHSEKPIYNLHIHSKHLSKWSNYGV